MLHHVAAWSAHDRFSVQQQSRCTRSTSCSSRAIAGDVPGVMLGELQGRSAWMRRLRAGNVRGR